MIFLHVTSQAGRVLMPSRKPLRPTPYWGGWLALEIHGPRWNLLAPCGPMMTALPPGWSQWRKGRRRIWTWFGGHGWKMWPFWDITLVWDCPNLYLSSRGCWSGATKKGCQAINPWVSSPKPDFFGLANPTGSGALRSYGYPYVPSLLYTRGATEVPSA